MSKNLVGSVIDGKYKVLSVLGSGGFGTVYKAQQPHLDRYVAIKVMHESCLLTDDDNARFVREAKNLANIQNENIVSLLGWGTMGNGNLFIVMEFVEGESLASILSRENKLSEKKTAFIARQVCNALSAAHNQGVIHRDLNPANIMLAAAGGQEIVKVLDFGLSKKIASGATSEQNLTKTGSLVGSINYMSPEMSEGRGAEKRSDLYSLGCIMYECLAGRTPFECDNPMGLLYMHSKKLPKQLSESVPNISESLERIIFKCLQKDPDARFDSADSLKTAIEYFESGRTGELDLGKIIMPIESTGSIKSRLPATIGLLLLLLGLPAILLASHRTIPGSKSDSSVDLNPGKEKARTGKMNIRLKQMPVASQLHQISSFIGRSASSGAELMNIHRQVVEYTDAITAQTKDPVLLFTAFQYNGISKHYVGQYAESRKSFESALENCKQASRGKDCLQAIYALDGIIITSVEIKDNGRAEKAARELLRICQLKDKVPESLISLNLPIEAGQSTSLRISQYPRALAYSTMSELANARGDSGEAIKYLNLAIADGKTNACISATPYLRKADILLAQGKVKEANEAVAKLKQQISSILPSIYQTEKLPFGMASREAVTQSLAVGNLSEVLSSYYDLGMWYKDHNEKKAAADCFRNVVQIDQNHPQSTTPISIANSKAELAKLESAR